MNAFGVALFLLLTEMAPYLLLGFLIAGLLHAFVPERITREYLADDRFRSVFWAAMLGVPLPLCSCGVIPTAMSLRKEGASRGATVSFLIATPQTGVDSILATGAILGWPFAMVRPLVALLTGLVAGELVQKCVLEEAETTSRFARKEPEKSRNRWVEALRYGFVEMIQDIGKWLVVGLVLAAGITVAIPDGFFERFSDIPWLGMLVILLLSIPMYVCATGSIPIAAALILKGFSPGAAFVLLMAGPATNMASMLVVGKVLGRKTLGIYLLTLVVGALSAGAFLDLCCPREWFAVVPGTLDHASCCRTGFWFKGVCGMLLVGLLFNALVRRYWGGASHSHSHWEEKIMKKTYRVTGMTCSHCQSFVERTLRALPGVVAVTVQWEQGIAVVEGDVPSETVLAAVKEIGFGITEDTF
ncbi:MAG: permease [Planctomycetia bacterium]|nr:permease [Planctomycetia bacterium]